jgi:hypothetical protein
MMSLSWSLSLEITFCHEATSALYKNCNRTFFQIHGISSFWEKCPRHMPFSQVSYQGKGRYAEGNGHTVCRSTHETMIQNRWLFTGGVPPCQWNGTYRSERDRPHIQRLFKEITSPRCRPPLLIIPNPSFIGVRNVPHASTILHQTVDRWNHLEVVASHPSHPVKYNYRWMEADVEAILGSRLPLSTRFIISHQPQIQ